MHWYTTCIGQGGPPDAGCCTGDAYRHTSTRTTRTPSRSCGQNQPSRFSKRLVVLARRSATTALNHHCMQDTTLACGRVWKPARRKTCPNGCRDLRICLTCDRVWPEDQVRGDLERRCAPPAEDLRDFVRQCGGDWDTAKRRLIAANGDLARAVVALDRSQGRNVFTDDARGDQPKPLPGPRPPGDRPELDDEEYDTFARSGRDPRAVQELRAERRREESY